MKNKKQNKAQMKIQQMSFMIIAVFIFLAVVGMMVFTIKLNSIRISANELEAQNAKLLASKIANSPEFSCGNLYGGSKTDCIDLDKVMALKSNVGKYTGDFWGVSNIEIRKVYPEWVWEDKECTPNNYPNCSMIHLITSSEKGEGKYNYVSLCRKEIYRKKIDGRTFDEIVDKCEIGKIIIRYGGEEDE